MKELVFKSDFAGIEPGTLQHETICAIARQFSSEPTPKHASLLLSVLLREANSENITVGFAIDRQHMQWRDENCIKEVFLAAAMALEDMNADTMFRFCQFVCFFLEHRLSEEHISKIAAIFHREPVKAGFPL